MTRALTIDDLSKIPTVSDPQLSPDGSQVAYVLTTVDNDAYVSRVWFVAVDGQSPPRAMTAGPTDAAPRWSPDGAALAFTAARGGPPQLHVLPLNGGESRQLTHLEGGATAPQWAPDGTSLLLSSVVSLSDPDASAPIVLDRLGYKADGAGMIGSIRTHVFVVDAVGGEARQLTSGDFHAAGAAWSPNGSRIAFGASMTEDRDLTAASAVYVVPTAGGEPTAVTPLTGRLGLPTWSGDDLVVVGTASLDSTFTKLYVGSEPVALDRNVMPGAPGYAGAQPVALADGTVLFAARDRGNTHVYAVAPGKEPHKVLAGEDRSYSGLSVRGDQIAFVASDPSTNGDIHVASVDGTGVRKLTSHLATALPDVELPRAESCEFTAPDGTMLHGWVLRDPQAAGATPLLLDIHGGPHNAWNPTFDGVHLYHHELVAQGWTVLILNPRGSDGYGEEFYTAVSTQWGLSDEHDFLSAVDALIADGLVDASKVVVTGYSYGGYMSCWLSARHPSRWAAAAPGGVVVDLVSMAGTADLGPLMSTWEFGGSPWAEADRLRACSPLTYVGDVTTPTLVLQGNSDDRCPVGQAEQWFAALRTRQVPVELVRYPGGSHLFILNGKPSHRQDWCRRIVDWAVKHAGT